MVLLIKSNSSLVFSFEGANFLEKRICDHTYVAGVNDAEVPPVPIPNTEVKLCRAENTWLETTRENR